MGTKALGQGRSTFSLVLAGFFLHGDFWVGEKDL